MTEQTYTLKALQARRQQALEAVDMPAFHAFDLLLGHALQCGDMYARDNFALKAYRAHCQALADEQAEIYAPSATAAYREWRDNG